jgi:hypothetical protein
MKFGKLSPSKCDAPKISEQPAKLPGEHYRAGTHFAETGMSRTPQAEQAIHAMRSVLMIVVFTAGSIYLIAGRAFPPHGNPLVYGIAISWLISMTIATVSSAILFRVNPKLFSLARWEKQGEVYDRADVRAFRWVLFRSPLGWINPNFHWRISRGDCDRLLREMNSSEGVHWLTCAVLVMLAISYLLHDHAVYGYVMLLVRIPFDLYPIMLQRWNRGRVSRVLERLAKKPTTTDTSDTVFSGKTAD